MSDLCARLLALAQAQDIPNKVQGHAQSLHDRLEKPLNIFIDGPDAPLVQQVAQSFPKDPGLFGLTNDFAKADIAVWCTQNFGPEEIALWEAAPSHLQDHSHLVSRTAPDLEATGGHFFRNCWPLDGNSEVGPVVAAVLRQIRLGQEAGQDQAIALLARYPTLIPMVEQPCVVAKTTTPYSDILGYLQGQANDLATMDISEAKDSCAILLARCAEAAEELTTMLADVPNATLQTAVFDALDAITLMVIEGDAAAATDAVTVLLQLQKEFKTEACLAV